MKNNDFQSHVTTQSNNIHLCFIITEMEKKTGIVFYTAYRIVASI